SPGLTNPKQVNPTQTLWNGQARGRSNLMVIVAGRHVLGWRDLLEPPPHRPKETADSGVHENPCPTEITQYHGDSWERDDGADRTSGVDDSHRCGALCGRKPSLHDAR